MRAVLCFVSLVALAACSSSTAPSSAGDPSLLFTNNLPSDYVYITWKDGNAILGRDSIPPRTASQCVRFTAQPDSAYWSITASETQNGLPTNTANATAPYFNPTSRPAWRVVVDDVSGVVVIKATDTAIAC